MRGINNPLNYVGSGPLQAIVTPTYPANDITAALQAAAASGSTYTLAQDSVFHQVILADADWELDLNGYTLQMFGLPTPVLVYGTICTGPAAWFLDSAGYPLGNPLATHPAGTQFNPIQANKSGLTLTVGGGTFDDNIGNLTDVWAGAVVGPTHNPTLVSDGLTIINSYGGYNGAVSNPNLWFPDPIHVDGNNCEITNYTFGVTNKVALDAAHPANVGDALVAGDASTNYTGITINGVTIGVGRIEFDGILAGATIENVTIANGHVSFASSIPSGSWSSAVMIGWTITAPGTTQVLGFASGVTVSGITMGESGSPCVFNGTITNGSNFQGNWYSGNTPSSP